ncbi:MAG: hypothetical protein QOD63_931, partial [Actinomycetota bacterium]|nr:hypothetical protein [Actinomycetota bacterium]
EPPAFAAAGRVSSWLGPGHFPGSPFLSAATAAIAVLTPFMDRRWRRVAWTGLWLAVLVRVMTSTALPGAILLTLAAGWFIGSLVLVVLGSPRRPPTTEDITDALARSACPVESLEPATVDAGGSTPYFADAGDGRRLFVKVLSDEERSADLLFRLYRWARFRNLGDERPFSSLKQEVEHEALCALGARDVGVRTPRMVVVAIVGASENAMLLAYERLDGSSLDGAAAGQLTDAVLEGIWRQVGVMRLHRIAHRDLGLANVFLGPDGHPWLVDFGFGDLAASDAQLSGDVAELLASTAAVVGVERAVAAAKGTIGTEGLASGLPRLQPYALGTATRSALKSQKGLLDKLREAAREASGVDKVELEHLQRVKPSTVFSFVMLAAVVYFLYPQLAGAGDIAHRLRTANYWWAAVAVVLSAVTYLGAAVSLAGSVPQRIGFRNLFVSQVASSFTNRITPAQAGGYALTVRFLQRQGVDTAVAVTSVGINTLGGILVHLPLALLFLLWVGSGVEKAFKVPSSFGSLAWIALGVVAVVAAIVVIPKTRRTIWRRLGPALGKAWAGLGSLVSHPSKLLLLLGGSLVITGGNLLALVASVAAFGGGASFASVGFVYLVGSVIGNAAPTPGGLGATEAVLTAGLSAAGLSPPVALSSVLLFRFATFWLPIPPGYLALRSLRHHELI